MKAQMSRAETPNPIRISPELEAKCSGPDQFEKFDALVGRIFSISAKRSDVIRGEASVNPNRRGRPRKTSPHA
jgi:hypothetical protein